MRGPVRRYPLQPYSGMQIDPYSESTISPATLFRYADQTLIQNLINIYLAICFLAAVFETNAATPNNDKNKNKNILFSNHGAQN